MIVEKYFNFSIWAIILVGISLGLITACDTIQNQTKALAEIHTQLLVRAPDNPLPLNKSVNVKSLTEAAGGVSHVELYAVEFPNQPMDPATGQKQLLLIRSDPASFQPSTFSADQTFTPLQPGHYVIKVIGYNVLGKASESEYIGFDVQ
jgi:hypothetical protein